jgi:hypothetical protein
MKQLNIVIMLIIIIFSCIFIYFLVTSNQKVIHTPDYSSFEKFIAKKYKKGSSNIHGNGIFANELIQTNDIIDICFTFKKNTLFITPNFGALINHCNVPNTEIINRNNTYYLKAIKNIYPNQEITSNYNSAPSFIQRPLSTFVQC